MSWKGRFLEKHQETLNDYRKATVVKRIIKDIHSELTNMQTNELVIELHKRLSQQNGLKLVEFHQKGTFAEFIVLDTRGDILIKYSLHKSYNNIFKDMSFKFNTIPFKMVLLSKNATRFKNGIEQYYKLVEKELLDLIIDRAVDGHAYNSHITITHQGEFFANKRNELSISPKNFVTNENHKSIDLSQDFYSLFKRLVDLQDFARAIREGRSFDTALTEIQHSILVEEENITYSRYIL